MIIGMSQDAIYFALILACFRMLHVYGGTVAMMALYGPKIMWIIFVEKYVLRDATALREMTAVNFCRENLPLVGGLLLLASLDVSIFQFFPWKVTRFTIESQGYPNMGLLKFSLTIKAIQSLVSVVCQTTYLVLNIDLSQPSTKITTKVLFIANIGFSFISLILSLILVVMKEELLSIVEDDEKKREERRRRKKQERRQLKDAMILQSIQDPSGNYPSFVEENPLHGDNPSYFDSSIGGTMNGGDIAAADIETMVGMHNDAVRGNSDNRNESDLQVTSQIEKMRRESIQILNSNDVQTLKFSRH